MKIMILAATMLAVALAGIDSAAAKTYRTHGGGSSHSTGATRMHAPRAAKAKTNYVIVTCKTKACLKKHPSGTYSFVPKTKKNQ
jgi:hypothetical protein